MNTNPALIEEICQKKLRYYHTNYNTYSGEVGCRLYRVELAHQGAKRLIPLNVSGPFL